MGRVREGSGTPVPSRAVESALHDEIQPLEKLLNSKDDRRCCVPSIQD